MKTATRMMIKLTLAILFISAIAVSQNPSLTNLVFSPASGTQTSSANATLSYSVNMDANIWFYVDNNYNGQVTVPAGSYTWSHTFTTGTHSVYIEALNYSTGGYSDVSLSYVVNAPAPPQYILTVSSDGYGTVSGSGTVTQGVAQQISAYASNGYQFGNWTVTSGTASIANPTSANTTVTLTSGNATVKANFAMILYTISTSSSPTNGGSTSGGGLFNYGSTATVNANFATGYTFTSWKESGNVVSTSSSYSFIVGSSRTLVANFTPQYTLTVGSSPSNGGTTSGGGTYNSGTQVSVNAYPASGNTFTGWSGDASGSANPLSVTMNGTKSITANFAAIPQYSVTISGNPSAGGTLGGGGTYYSGTPVTVTASQNTGYTFMNWTEGATVVSSNASYTFTLGGNRTLVANFTPIPYTVTLSSNPSAVGTPGGGGTFYLGNSVTVTAPSNSGYIFTNWTEGGNPVSPNPSYTFTVGGNRTLVANFVAIPQYTVTLSSSPSAGGTLGGGGTYYSGTLVTVTASQNTGYTFMNWTEGATVVSSNASYTFTLGGNRTLVANFTAIPQYNVTISANPSAGGTTGGGGTFNFNTSVTVTATTNTGYTFTNWTEGTTVVSTNASYSFTVSGNRILVANFVYVPNTTYALMPTTPGGTNSVIFDQNSGASRFCFSGNAIYYFSANDGSTYLTSGGCLNSISARTKDGSTNFLPSNAGGPIIRVGGTSGTDIYPCTPGVTFHRNGVTFDGSKVITHWTMHYGVVPFDASFEYQYSMSISGQTLIINVIQLCNYNCYCSGFVLDRCENASPAKLAIVKVPYLPLFNLLYANGSFVSMFFDWETTNCSRYLPSDKSTETYSSTSKRFAPYVLYDPKRSDGSTNWLIETIYLTVADNLDNVYPNLAGSPTPYKNKSSNQIVLSFHPQFNYLSDIGTPDWPWHYDYLKRMYDDNGVRNIAVIAKDWQNGGFDNKYPVVLPPNPLYNNQNTPSGTTTMTYVRNHIVNDLHYDFAVHENYADYYSNADPGSWGYSDANISLLPFNMSGPNGESYVFGFNNNGNQARILKPSLAPGFADYWSGQIKTAINPTWSYLDVHTASDISGGIGGPLWSKVDYESDGKFLTTLTSYRQIADKLRKYNGPVEGEGGYQFLYAGYFDDFDGWIKTADPALCDKDAPLFVDFALQKIHPKSNLHGVGHIGIFEKRDWDYSDFNYSDESHKCIIQKYMATELAYGNGGLVTKASWGQPLEHSIDQARLEYQTIFPMQQIYMNDNVNEIKYSDGSSFYSASEYIATYPDCFNINSSNIMSRVRVTYNSGLIVWVNRNSAKWTIQITNLTPKYSWNLDNTIGPQIRQTPTTNSIDLKPNCGWACYYPSLSKQSPILPMNDNKTNTPQVFNLGQNYPNPFNPSTVIGYQLPTVSSVKLAVYDMLGREVTTLANGVKDAGYYNATFDGTRFSSGLYFVRFTAQPQDGNQPFVKVMKMLMVK